MQLWASYGPQIRTQKTVSLCYMRTLIKLLPERSSTAADTGYWKAIQDLAQSSTEGSRLAANKQCADEHPGMSDCLWVEGWKESNFEHFKTTTTKTTNLNKTKKKKPSRGFLMTPQAEDEKLLSKQYNLQDSAFVGGFGNMGNTKGAFV